MTMGIFLSQMRMAEIIKYRSDLEYQIHLINATKLDLSSQVNAMVGLEAEMDADSPEKKALEKKKERLMQVEKSLDLQLQRYQSQLEMINQEEQGVKQQLQTSIQRSFAA